MKITRLTRENEKEFLSFLPGRAKAMDRDIIRIGAVDDKGTPAGALSAEADITHADILSLYVLPSCRGKGCGRTLMDTFTAIIKDTGFLTVSCEYPEEEGLDAFLVSQGFDLFSGKDFYITTLGEILRSPMNKRLGRIKEAKDLKFVSDLQPGEKKVFDNYVLNKDYNADWSTARMKNGKYESCLLTNCSENGINVIWTDSVEKSPDDFRHHIKMLITRALEGFSDKRDLPVRMTFEREEVCAFVAKVLGGREHLRREGRYINAIKII